MDLKKKFLRFKNELYKKKERNNNNNPVQSYTLAVAGSP